MLPKTGSIDIIRSTASAAPILKEPRIEIISKFSSTLTAQSNFVWYTAVAELIY